MEQPISIAIETSCRRGGVAVGSGDRLLESRAFQADRKHAVQLVAQLDELLGLRGLAARDVREVYVSVGPGSFTGLRVGVTVARTLAQAVDGLRTVAVPTTLAVAQNAAELAFEHLAVIMDARFGDVYAGCFTRRDGSIVPADEPALLAGGQFAARCPKPITLMGEGLGYHEMVADGVTLADESLWLPRPEGVWAAGRQLAGRQAFTNPNALFPTYLRKPEAVRLWEQRQR